MVNITPEQYDQIKGVIPVQQGNIEIVAECLMINGVHDSESVAVMLAGQKTPVGMFYGDGIFDTWNLYGALEERGIEPVGRRKWSRKGWKVKAGYHRRSLADTAMFRMKTIFDGRLKNHV